MMVLPRKSSIVLWLVAVPLLALSRLLSLVKLAQPIWPWLEGVNRKVRAVRASSRVTADDVGEWIMANRMGLAVVTGRW